MCMIDLGDAPQLYRQEMRKARKEHLCEECTRAILVGESYRRSFSVQDGSASTFRTCRHCVVAQDWLAENCGGWMFSMCLEEMREHAREYPPLGFSLLRIAVGMKRRWRGFTGLALLPTPKMPATIESVVSP